MPRRRPAAPVDDGPHLVVHPDWLTHVSGVCAPVVCDIRPASGPDLLRAGELFGRAGRDDVVAAHAAGTSIVLIAWIDPEIVVPEGTEPRSRPAHAPSSRALAPTVGTAPAALSLTARHGPAVPSSAAGRPEPARRSATSATSTGTTTSTSTATSTAPSTPSTTSHLDPWPPPTRRLPVAPAAGAISGPAAGWPRATGPTPPGSTHDRAPDASSRHPTLAELSAASLPVGFVELRWDGPADAAVHDLAGDCVELMGPYVDRPVRCRGIGRALLGAAENRCLLAGRPRIVSALGRLAAADGRPGGSGTVHSGGVRGEVAASRSGSVGATAHPAPQPWWRPGDGPTPVPPDESAVATGAGSAATRLQRWADAAGYRPLCPCVVRAEVVRGRPGRGVAVRARRSADGPGPARSRGGHLGGADALPPLCLPGDCAGFLPWWVRDVVDPTAAIRVAVGRARLHP